MSITTLRSTQVAFRTLVFAITALDLLMHAFLYLSFQYPRSGRLVKVCDFQNVRGIDPIIGSAAHYMVALNEAFVYRNLSAVRLSGQQFTQGRNCRTLL